MSPSLEHLDQALRANSVIAADSPVLLGADGERPWFIALLQGFAGWLAGIFLLVFLGIVFRPDERITILLLGAILLVAAWAIYRLDREGAFFDQFALALSIAGQFAVAWGLIEDDFHGLTASVSLLILQIAIWRVMPNRIARTLAALFATVAWVYTVRFMLRPAHGFEDLFGFGHRAESDFSAGLSILGWLLTWAPLVAAVWWLLERECRWVAQGASARLRPALTGLLSGLSLAGIAAEPVSVLVLGTQQWGMQLTWAALFPLLSIALAAFAAYGAFRVRSAGLLGIAILAALLHLARFYYFYGTTLLWKSLLMVGVAVVLLCLAHWARRKAIEVEA